MDPNQNNQENKTEMPIGTTPVGNTPTQTPTAAPEASSSPADNQSSMGSETPNTLNTESQFTSAPDEAKGNKMILLVVIVVFLVLVLGVVYFLVLRSNTPAAPTPVAVPTIAPTTIPTATPTLPPDEELQVIDLGDPTTDLEEINVDVQQL